MSGNAYGGWLTAGFDMWMLGAEAASVMALRTARIAAGGSAGAAEAEHSGITFGQQHVGRPLLTPDEVRTLSPNRQLLFLAGQRPVIAAKLRYYADREFAGRYDQA